MLLLPSRGEVIGAVAAFAEHHWTGPVHRKMRSALGVCSERLAKSPVERVVGTTSVHCSSRRSRLSARLRCERAVPGGMPIASAIS